MVLVTSNFLRQELNLAKEQGLKLYTLPPSTFADSAIGGLGQCSCNTTI